MGSRVKAIGTYELVFNGDFVSILAKTFYIPNFSKNLISVSRLAPYGYSFNFRDGITLFYNTHLVGNGTLSNGLYHINLQSDVLYTLHVDDNAGIKRCVMNEDASGLWHLRLGHISIKRIKKLEIGFEDVRIWRCLSEVRVYNPQEKKLDPRTISGYFIGYAERSKGYKFYCPSNNTRIVESRNAKFLDDDLISGSDKGLSIRSNVDNSEFQPSTSSNGLIVVVHNTPTVQMRVERPIQIVPQVDDHELLDPVVPHISENVEQPIDQQAPSENVDATL
ncbi:UNVERIFIED_CONTAM: hypothetical protein Sangu_3073200 [Sesamum angustifolium]|uniref:Retroviral polymerase SH3-like domain-containing protein n=1 Tax=Sesamum angustifolium TaxID=2727405 RepID=A0AAW2KCT1_9LAMI